MTKGIHFRLNFTLHKGDPEERACHDFLVKRGKEWLIPELKRFVIAAVQERIKELKLFLDGQQTPDASDADPKDQAEASAQPPRPNQPSRQDSLQRPAHPQDSRRLEIIKHSLRTVSPDMAEKVLDRPENARKEKKTGIQILEEHQATMP